jgi:hypothetical protein
MATDPGIAAATGWSEERFLGHVKELAEVFGFLYYHVFDSRLSTAGFPDLVLVRPKPRPALYFIELKTDSKRSKTTAAQEEWLQALRDNGVTAEVWRPRDIQEIADVLAGGKV